MNINENKILPIVFMTVKTRRETYLYEADYPNKEMLTRKKTFFLAESNVLLGIWILKSEIKDRKKLKIDTLNFFYIHMCGNYRVLEPNLLAHQLENWTYKALRQDHHQDSL